MAASRVGSRATERILPGWLRVVVLAVLLAFALVPVLYVIIASISSDVDVAAGNLWPEDFNFGNYQQIWNTVPLARGLANSFLVAGVVAIVSSLLAAAAAYFLVRYRFRGRLTVLRSLVGLQSIPGTLLLVPIFVLFAFLGSKIGISIIGTTWGLIITYLTFAMPFATWVMVTYMRGLPCELDEAARIDGASSFTLFRTVILPLSWPGIVVAAVFSFLLGWNDVMYAQIMTKPSSRTVAVVLQVFSTGSEGGALPPYGQMMAASLVCAIPVVALYLGFQRFLVTGLTAGSDK